MIRANLSTYLFTRFNHRVECTFFCCLSVYQVTYLFFKADDCQNYQTLSDAERKHDYATVWPNQCDNTLSIGWYRFQGAAGTKMATSSSSESRCDASYPAWMNGAHPTVNEGIVIRKVCIHKWGVTCRKQLYIQVKNCGSYYIYELKPTPGCDIRYCGTD